MRAMKGGKVWQRPTPLPDNQREVIGEVTFAKRPRAAAASAPVSGNGHGGVVATEAPPDESEE
jgi:hypothetical protein